MTMLIRLSAVVASVPAAVWCAQQFTRAATDAAQCVEGLTTGLLVAGAAVLLYDALHAMRRRPGRGDRLPARALRGTSGS